MVEETHPCREPEHRKDPFCRESFAQGMVRRGGRCHAVNFGDQIVCDVLAHRIDPFGVVQRGTVQNRAADDVDCVRIARNPSRHARSVGRPILNAVEFSVHVVAAVGDLKRFERPSQHFLIHHPLGNFGTPHINVGRRGWLGRDQSGPLEVVVVVAAPAAQGQCCGHAQAPSTCAAHSLLIVETHGGHVSERDRLERPDVDSRLHGGRHAQEIHTDRTVHFFLHEDFLESSLAQPPVDPVRLPCQLLAVQAKRGLIASSEEFVVVNRRVLDRVCRRCGCERCSARRAETARGVQVRTLAPGATVRVDVPGRVGAWADYGQVIGVHEPLLERWAQDPFDLLLEVLRGEPVPWGCGLEVGFDVARRLPLALRVAAGPSPFLRKHAHRAGRDFFGGRARWYIAGPQVPEPQRFEVSCG